MFRNPRYPVVLCHGLFGFDYIGFEKYPKLQINYWSGVTEALTNNKCDFLVGKVHPTASIRMRAHSLADQIRAKFPDQKVNLVGFSMGGLDARYVAAKELVPVDSVTTVSTPHRGSSFADWCFEQFNPDSRRLIESLLRRLDINISGFENLTTKGTTKFNQQNPNNPNTKYYSFASSIESTKIFKLSFKIVSEREGPNDGLVSVKSAEWGQLIDVLNVDHMDLSSNWESSSGFDVGLFYLKWIDSLYQRGH